MSNDPERRFPIQRGPSIRWSVIAPHQAQCILNHSQTLERLAERGGLDPIEALAVYKDEYYPIGPDKACIARMREEWAALVARTDAEYDERGMKMIRLKSEFGQLQEEFVKLKAERDEAHTHAESIQCERDAAITRAKKAEAAVARARQYLALHDEAAEAGQETAADELLHVVREVLSAPADPVAGNRVVRLDNPTIRERIAQAMCAFNCLPFNDTYCDVYRRGADAVIAAIGGDRTENAARFPASAVAAQTEAEREARAPRGPACDVCDGAEPPDASEDQGRPFAVTDRPCPECSPRLEPPVCGKCGGVRIIYPIGEAEACVSQGDPCPDCAKKPSSAAGREGGA